MITILYIPSSCFLRYHDACPWRPNRSLQRRKLTRKFSPSSSLVAAIAFGTVEHGMEETYQQTTTLKHLSWGKQFAVITDARFSGVTTAACIGHASPEALAGGPLGKLRDGDLIQINIDRNKLGGSVNLVGDAASNHGVEWGNRTLATRELRSDLAADAQLPDDTRLWAILPNASGGVWGGCVYDAEAIARAMDLNQRRKGSTSA